MATTELPYELGQLIFEYAARLDRASIPILMRVSRLAKTWTEPFLYSAIIRHTDATEPLPAPSYSPPSERLESYAHHVRHLLVVFHVDWDIVRDHLRLCTGLTTVSLWCHALSPDIVDLLSRLSLRHLAVNIQELFRRELPDDYKHTLFRCVTHLEILGYDLTWEELSGLRNLPQMTHLALNDIEDSDLVESILESCPNLKVVVLYGDASELPHELLANDRIISFQYPFDRYIQDWICCAESRRCVWDEAEEGLERKVSKIGPVLRAIMHQAPDTECTSV
ncbi:hypothetical protein BDN72DRAFT_851538 [Pluteus cervinus]|uniref:Uncharacterized protein n=1 Tax=Pluteus cervinus TaxID=181527 RepID=A0ACD2ZZB7_9AGAR|nr:hypothetical protein BDN72DRAFT_851538 [Pluteus cervinus]